MIKLITAAALAVSLAACATTTVSKPGATPSQINRDIQECEYEGMKASPMNALIARQITVRCLKLKGYSL